MRSVVHVGIVLACCGMLASLSAHAACDGKEHRQFDFWLGQWQVHKADGALAGSNRIESEYGGCVVHEHYSTAKGYSGESLNIYDAASKHWHQTWVDSDGLLLQLDGGLEDGKMVLQGRSLDAEGRALKQRITWTPNADGSVRQLWESADAEGKWTVAFDGLYSRN